MRPTLIRPSFPKLLISSPVYASKQNKFCSPVVKKILGLCCFWATAVGSDWFFFGSKITKPLFVIQGANDPRVNIDESDQIVSGLRAKGVNVPYMVKYDEGHGFAKEENRMALYSAMMGFLAQNLKD